MDLSDVFKSTLLIGPEISLIVAGIVLIILGPILKKKAGNYVFVLALIGLGIAFGLNIERFGTAEVAFGGALSLDQYAAYFNVIFLIGALAAVIFSKDYLSATDEYAAEFYALILFSTSGMMILSSAKEFMSLFLGFEIMSISVYVLTAFNRKSARSTEAGIKYLVLGGFSSAILLYGIALLYGASGTIYLTEILKSFDMTNPLYIAGAALVLIGFIFKIGAFPLHQWVPDIYEGAPVSVTAFMSVGVKAAAFAILLRVIFESFYPIQVSFMPLLWVIAIFTIIVGNVAAIVQSSVKRMLAYSSIAHAGYALIGVVAAYGGQVLAVSSVIYYLFAYTFMNLGAFGVLTYLSRDGKECETFDDLSGLWSKRPFVALALGIFMFSLAGIPPTIGFFAKYRVFLSAVQAEFYWLAVIGIVGSVISAYYYLRVLVYAFMRPETSPFPTFKAASSIALIVLSVATVALGIFPFDSWDLALKAAGTVLAAARGG